MIDRIDVRYYEGSNKHRARIEIAGEDPIDVIGDFVNRDACEDAVHRTLSRKFSGEFGATEIKHHATEPAPCP